jgi:hypothetical protein
LHLEPRIAGFALHAMNKGLETRQGSMFPPLPFAHRGQEWKQTEPPGNLSKLFSCLLKLSDPHLQVSDLAGIGAPLGLHCPFKLLDPGDKRFVLGLKGRFELLDARHKRLSLGVESSLNVCDLTGMGTPLRIDDNLQLLQPICRNSP